MRGEAPIDIDLDRSAPPWKATRAALVIAHPGHELRVHHWLEQSRPIVLVLTDGSGHTDRSRLASTTVALQRVGAVPGQLYGRFSDREFYRMILAADPAPFFALAEEIARVPIQHAWDLPTQRDGRGGLTSNASAGSRSAIDRTMRGVSSVE